MFKKVSESGEGGRKVGEREKRQSRGQGQDEKGCGVGDCRVLAQGSVPAYQKSDPENLRALLGREKGNVVSAAL